MYMLLWPYIGISLSIFLIFVLFVQLSCKQQRRYLVVDSPILQVCTYLSEIILLHASAVGLAKHLRHVCTFDIGIIAKARKHTYLLFGGLAAAILVSMYGAVKPKQQAAFLSHIAQSRKIFTRHRLQGLVTHNQNGKSSAGVSPVVSGIGDAAGALVGAGADGAFPVVVPALAAGAGAAAC